MDNLTSYRPFAWQISYEVVVCEGRAMTYNPRRRADPYPAPDRVPGVVAYYRCVYGHEWTCWWAGNMAPFADCCNDCRADLDGHNLSVTERYRTHRPHLIVPEVHHTPRRPRAHPRPHS
jgi:hypothetical protein